MDFVVAWFAGAPVDAVVELTRPVREHSLVLVSGEWTPTDASGGALWSHRRAVSSAVVHGTVEDLPVVSADLSRIVTSVQDLSSIVARASAHHSDIVAIRDAKQWNRKSVVGLIERLRDSGKRVVLFTDTAEALGELATMDATVAVVADQHDQAVVGTRGGDSWSSPVARYPVSELPMLRIDDIATALSKHHIEVPEPVGPASTDDNPARAEASSGVRNVNSVVVEPGGTHSVDVSQPLTPGTDYEVM